MDAKNTLVYNGAAAKDLQRAGNLRPSKQINMREPMQQVVKVNVSLWNSASRTERQWIHNNLVNTGLIGRSAQIEGTAEADLLEIAEIDSRVKKLEAKHAGSGCAGRCRKAYADAVARCASIIFADQRKRFKNAAYQAYALCLQRCPDNRSDR